MEEVVLLKSMVMLKGYKEIMHSSFRAVKYFIRMYTYFHVRVNLKNKFYKWRTNALCCESVMIICM